MRPADTPNVPLWLPPSSRPNGIYQPLLFCKTRVDQIESDWTNTSHRIQMERPWTVSPMYLTIFSDTSTTQRQYRTRQFDTTRTTRTKRRAAFLSPEIFARCFEIPHTHAHTYFALFYVIYDSGRTSIDLTRYVATETSRVAMIRYDERGRYVRSQSINVKSLRNEILRNEEQIPTSSRWATIIHTIQCFAC